MKKAIVIGGSGHVGSYIVPQLVKDGYNVISISRGKRTPYTIADESWKKVEQVTADRAQMEEAGTFGKFIADFQADVICDTISFSLEQTTQLCEAINRPTHLIQIGTIWVYDRKYWSPVTEDHPRTSPSEYGIKKTQIENYLFNEIKNDNILSTIIQPGHVSGSGWLPINPQGNLNPDIYKKIINGDEIILPGDGQNTLHHVHSQDIASLTSACLKQPDKSNGECFHSVAAHAVTFEGFARMLSERYGKEANIKFMPWEELKEILSESDARITYDHMSRSPVCSVEKAYRLLGFYPEHSIIDTVVEALTSIGLTN